MTRRSKRISSFSEKRLKESRSLLESTPAEWQSKWFTLVRKSRYSRNRATCPRRDLSSRPTANPRRIAFDLEFRIWSSFLDVRYFFPVRSTRELQQRVRETYESSIVVLTKRRDAGYSGIRRAKWLRVREVRISSCVRYWSTAVGGKVSKILCWRFSAWCLREISSYKTLHAQTLRTWRKLINPQSRLDVVSPNECRYVSLYTVDVHFSFFFH